MDPALESFRNSMDSSFKDDRDGCRSLICDANGIIIAEVVYRCMICSAVINSTTDARNHYHSDHIDLNRSNGHSSNGPIISPEDLTIDASSDEEDFSFHRRTDHNGNDEPMSSAERRGKKKPTRRSNTNNLNGNDTSNHSPPYSQTYSDVKILTAGTNGSCTIKSGHITCPVCLCTKFYTTLQRRYGQFSCVGCYRFFKEFFVQPKRFTCPNLGECPLDQRTKCKACWIQRCINIYSVDGSRKEILIANRPLKRNTLSPAKSTSSSLAVDDNQQVISSFIPVCNENSQDSNSKSKYESDPEENTNSIEESYEQSGNYADGNHDGLNESSFTSPDNAMNHETRNTSPRNRADKTPARRKTSGRIKNWCCLKCANCMADDCGKCINCLDRPKFGGPFIRKQRCLYKKCLLKTKPVVTNQGHF